MKNLSPYIIVGSILIYLALPQMAYAYLDPGTGSYVFQMLIAGILGGLFFIKSGIEKFKNKFKNEPNAKKSERKN